LKATKLLLIAALTVACLAAPQTATAQPRAEKVWRIGVLLTIFAPDARAPQAFRQRLRELGYVEGQNLVIEWRYAEGHDDRLPGLAAELVRRNVHLIAADVTVAVQAAMRATTAIPIVMTNSADAVGAGLVSNLARPGGNVTGHSIMHPETSLKRLQLLRDTLPKISRVAVLWNPGTPFHQTLLKDVAAAAPALQLQPVVIAVKSRNDLGDARAEIAKGRVDALFVNDIMAPATRRQLLDFAARNRLPSMFSNREWVPAGGLMSYSPNLVEMLRHAADYADRILKGAKPGDLPVEQPTKFELVINLRTARALGLTIPPLVLSQADELIE
jgi:putative tryptophan/tyrosine transport system substrate-binding protein